MIKLNRFSLYLALALLTGPAQPASGQDRRFVLQCEVEVIDSEHAYLDYSDGQLKPIFATLTIEGTESEIAVTGSDRIPTRHLAMGQTDQLAAYETRYASGYHRGWWFVQIDRVTGDLLVRKSERSGSEKRPTDCVVEPLFGDRGTGPNCIRLTASGRCERKERLF